MEKSDIIYNGINFCTDMKKKAEKVYNGIDDPLLPQVSEYLNKFDFPLAYLIQRKFKIRFSRAEKILRQIEARKNA